MGTIRAEARHVIAAPPAVVYACLADFSHHEKFLPPAFSNFEVVSGGTGAGTVARFTVTAGGRSRNYEMEVSEPEPGRVLVETDKSSSLVTTFTVDADGAGARVTISTTWQSAASGIGGFFEKRFAPLAMAKIYQDELRRLDAYATQQAASA
ncbi:MAG: SRPBCC family protein [Actinomycetota bacterium]|nr:SRPBCC family protein [Actinomycetota bacterium]